MAAADLRDRCLDVPPRQDHHAEEPVARVGLHLGGGVVEDLHGEESERLVLLLDELLPAEAERVGVDDLGPDAELVHERHAFVDVERRRLDVVVAHAGEAQAEVLGPGPVDHRRRAGRADDGAVEDPDVAAVDDLDAGHPVRVFGRRT
jgi:hypothetical protein